VACQPKGPAGDERPDSEPAEGIDPRGYDPLELPSDREIVPQNHPQHGAIVGSGMTEDITDVVGDDSSAAAVPIEIADSISGQAFRVQLFTSKIYGEARGAVDVAEEIFDQPVYLDYEVPYYKVRVGNFADRDVAEGYRQKARTAGYENAWVVIVNLAMHEVRPLYDDLPEGQIEPDSAAAPDVPVGVDQVNDE